MKILIVEDDANLGPALRDSLVAAGHTIDLASDGGEGTFLGKSYPYDIILLDYSLPKKDGITVCKELRTAGIISPIIFMSVIDDLDTKIKALEQGADDYVVKPVAIEELKARFKALQRRPVLKNDGSSRITVGDITLDTTSQRVTRNGKEIILTRKEFGVLEYLMRHADSIVSRVLIMEYVWTADSDPLSNTIETHMRNLRKKLNLKGTRDLISNVPGRGYMISAQ